MGLDRNPLPKFFLLSMAVVSIALAIIPIGTDPWRSHPNKWGVGCFGRAKPAQNTTHPTYWVVTSGRYFGQVYSLMDSVGLQPHSV